MPSKPPKPKGGKQKRRHKLGVAPSLARVESPKASTVVDDAPKPKKLFAFDILKPTTYSLQIRPIKLPFIIKLLYWVSWFWEWIIYAMVATTYGLVTYVSIFSFYDATIFSIVLGFDILYALDCTVRVLVEVWRYRSETPCIVFPTPYTLFQFTLDMISILPSERIFILIVGTNNLNSLSRFDLYRYNRFLRFTRPLKFMGVATQQGWISEKAIFLLTYLTMYLAFIQTVSCIFYLLLPLNPIDFMLGSSRKELAGTWMGSLRDIKPDYATTDFDIFVLCSSFSTAVVTTTGYGDLSPKEESEMLFAIFVMLIGAILLSGLFTSGLTSFELEQDGTRFDLFFRVKAIMAHLHYMKASPLFRQKVKEYYSLLWNYREGVFDVPFFDQLPLSMQENMLYDICQEMFHLAPLFRDMDENFLRSVARIAKVVLYNPDMILCAGGSYAINMFYIIQGECRVKSKFSPHFTAAILRAGCIIGEVNLFFSFPYTTTIETKTCCQLLKIEKESLFELFDKHPNALTIFRERVFQRLERLQELHELVGQEPVTWVSYKDDLGLGGKKVQNDRPISMRRAGGLNSVVDEDVVDDTRHAIIVGMPCIDKRFQKKHTTVYETCVIPPILSAEEKWVKGWVIFTLLLSLYEAFLSPYCQVFESATNRIEFAMCEFDTEQWWVLSILYLIDILVEITQSVPVSGFYYRLRDGWGIKATEVTFWIDVFAAFPWQAFESSTTMRIINSLFRALKLWKVIRYFHYLDNVHPNKLFAFRLLQTTLVLLYGVHFLACIVYGLACPIGAPHSPPNCKSNSWLRSYQVTFPMDEDVKIKYNYLGEEIPYLISFYFSSATLTSAGFGDFSPQTRIEMMFMIVFELVSFGLIGYYTAVLTSALSCTVRPKLSFQQKLFAIRQFMDHNGLNVNLRHRVLQHYYLQDHLWSGVNLPADTFHMMYDTPDYLHEDALFLEVELHFDGVPIFTKLDAKTIVKITKLVRRYLIPPGITFLRKGEIRRQMYVIGRGSVAIMAENTQIILKVLEATSHFGLRDLIFGEPSRHNIQTLSYCLMYEIELRDLNQVFEKDSDLKDLIDAEKRKLKTDIDFLTQEYSKNRATVIEKVDPVRSWLRFPPNSKTPTKHCSVEDFEEVFENLRFKCFYYVLLMRQTINPAGLFAQIWSGWMSLVSAMTLLTLIMETFMGFRSRSFRWLEITLDLINFSDIYLRFHWGYYTDMNVLISHPVMTAMNYAFEGPFVYDILFTAPFELMIVFLDWGNFYGYSYGAFWYTKIRWTRVGQILRIPAAVKIAHNIFKLRSIVLLSLYVTATLFLSTAISGIASYMACPQGPRIWEEGDENRLPFCRKTSWAFKKDSVTLDQMYERWVFGVYYVSQVILVIGFGDMITLTINEIYLSIFMMIFGFIIMRCVVADITAAEVDIDEVRGNYLERRKCISLCMARENVHSKLVAAVDDHLTNNWRKSKGLQPRQLFADLHPALEADLFRNFVGEQLKRVPIFSTLTENVVRTLCQFMKKRYFVKGERLVRYGNLEFEMFIIVEGKVWIVDKDYKWKCTLKGGQSFGDTSILRTLPRRYTAVAGSSVEVFVLTSEDFQDVLERYPTLKSDMSRRLKDTPEDIFERQLRRIRDRQKKAETTRMGVRKDFKTDMIAETLKLKDYPELQDSLGESGKTKSLHISTRLKRSYGRLFGHGILDDHLTFFYFASSKKGHFKFLFHPNCGFIRYFTELTVWLSFISCCLAAYEISFSNDSNLTPLDVANVGGIIPNIAFAIEFPLYIAIFLKFVTPFLLYEGQYCKQFRPIAINYVTSWKKFPLDIIAALPVKTMIDFGAVESSWGKWLYLVRFLRLFYFYRTQLGKQFNLNVSTFRYKITISLSAFLLMAHFLACVFYLLSPCQCPEPCPNIRLKTAEEVENIVQQQMCRPHTWTSKFVQDNDVSTLEEMAPWRWYVRSLYWVVSTVSTTGFGDITSQTAQETIVAIVCIFCGAFVLAIILSHFTTGAASLNQRRREYFYKVTLLAKYLTNLGMTNENRDLLLAYFRIKWEQFRGIYYHKAADILPLTLKIEVCYALMFSVVSQCRIFQGIEDRSFLRQVCKSMTHYIYLAGTNIVNHGDAGDRMFIVFRGKVSGFTIEKGRPVLKKLYNPGKVFGRFPALFFDGNYNKSYRTEQQSEVLSINQDTIITLAKFYPAFALNLKEQIDKKYSEVDSKTNIFQHKKAKKEKFKYKAPPDRKVDVDVLSRSGREKHTQHKEEDRQRQGTSTPVGQPISYPERLFKLPEKTTESDKPKQRSIGTEKE